jgi:hypothetical protein
MNLRTAVVSFPTPVADDTGHRSSHYAQGGTALSMVAGGPLNPTWVEWLMGFPAGWTELPPSEALVPQIAEWIGRRIIEWEGGVTA